MNPWNLTPAQVRVMRAMIAHGSNKHAARQLDLSVKTVDSHINAARRRMAKTLPSKGRLTYFLEFDRWDRSPK